MDKQRLRLIKKNDSVRYTPGSPLLLEKSALYYDEKTSNFVAQIKWKNLSDEEINSVKIWVYCCDCFQDQLGSHSYEYKELHAKPNTVFGIRKALIIAEKFVADIDISVESVSFAGGGIWQSNNDNCFIPLPDPKSIQLPDLLHQQLLRDFPQNGHKYKYALQTSYDLWQCACGSWQKTGKICNDCGQGMAYLHWAMNPTHLETNLEQYLNEQEIIRRKREEEEEQERAEKKKQEMLRLYNEKIEEEQRIAKAEAKRLRKRALRKTFLFLFVILVINLAIGAFFFAYQPYHTYLSATQMVENGQYEEGVNEYNKVIRNRYIFPIKEIWDYVANLGGYDDADAQIEKAYYKYGKELLENGFYNEAIASFGKVGHSYDGDTQIKMAYYQYAINLLENDSFDEAIIAFEKADKYQDSETKIQECRYKKAEKLVNQGDLEEAARIYAQIGTYGDVTKLLEENNRLNVLTQRIIRKEKEDNESSHTYHYSDDRKYLMRCYNFEEKAPGEYSFSIELLTASNRNRLGSFTVTYEISDTEIECIGLSDKPISHCECKAYNKYELLIQLDCLEKGKNRTANVTVNLNIE